MTTSRLCVEVIYIIEYIEHQSYVLKYLSCLYLQWVPLDFSGNPFEVLFSYREVFFIIKYEQWFLICRSSVRGYSIVAMVS